MMTSHSTSDDNKGFLKTKFAGLFEVYESRNILKSLVTKNLVGRYKNSVLGIGWHFLMPIFMLLVYYIVFTEIRTNSLPNFWIYLSSGLFSFSFMLSNLINGSTVLINNSNIIKKMYFPRSIIVIAQIISTFVILLIGNAIVILAILLTGNSLNILALISMPLFLVLMVLFSLGYTLVVSSITVYIRDVQYILNSISMGFFFVTPMYFSTDNISGMLNTIVWLNPFTYYIEAFHEILYYNCLPSLDIALLCLLTTVTALLIGYIVFRKLKHGFAERL